MKRLLGIIGLASLVAAVGGLPLGSAGGAATTSPYVALVQTIDVPPVDVTPGDTQVYIVHGLNLAGQDAQSDRGNAVTVCADGATLDADFQFGDISGPAALAGSSTVAFEVFIGAGVDCASTAPPLITEQVTVPAAGAIALIATSGPGAFTPALAPVVLDVTAPAGCGPVDARVGADVSQVAPPPGRLQAVHAAAAPAMSIDIAATENGPISYGETLGQDLDPGTYAFAAFFDPVTPVLKSAVSAVVTSCGSTIVYIVGNQALPEPATTTTTATPAPPAVAATASPSFTG